MYTLYRNQTNQTQNVISTRINSSITCIVGLGSLFLSAKELPVTGSGSYVASSTSSGATIKFTIDSQTLCLSGRVVFSNMGTVETNKHVLLGSILSAFPSIKLRPNGTQVEEIVNPGPVFARLWDLVLDRSAKLALSAMLLFDPVNPGAQGIILNSNNSSGTGGDSHNNMNSNSTFAFCIPIPCIISQMANYFPLYASNVDFEFTLDNPSNYITQVVTATASIPTVTFSNLELFFQTVRFEGEAFAKVLEATPPQDGMLCLKSSTWLYNAVNLPASLGVGRTDLLYSVQAKSIKRIVMWATPSNAPGKLFDGVQPNSSGIQLVTGSTTWPAQPVSWDNPAIVMAENQRALSALFSSSHCGNIHPKSFGRASTEFNDYYDAYNTDAANLALAVESATGALGFASVPLTDCSLLQNKFVYIMDCESLNGQRDGLYHGLSSRGTSSTIRLNIATALPAYAHTFSMWSEVDTKILIHPDLFQTVVDN
ncbi:MAG: hypothetical protein EOP48_05730 [Sphingobacteriales bacterium]|nr:MAG: hypothetical protein EOP48_05730 [Sphingobacteriales bacterium]